ncbi:MAG: flagellar hook-basal body complex protein [Defluviitaleaceae bacterium]|nr:flagellar hook-basal body complex protein [Defluviitaleaceae bacterium]
MMRSMFSGVSSLRVHQTRMDVIANNIANVNTTGFKGQRALFSDALYQNLQGATMPDARFGRTGMNPMQVGLGLNLASIDNLMHQGIVMRTDQPLDVAIEGRGFLIVQDRGTQENLFTRAGNIRRDSEWNLHVNGNALMGWSTVPCDRTFGGWAVNHGNLVPLSFQGEKQFMPAEATSMIDILGTLSISNLAIDRSYDPPMEYRILPIRFFDSLGSLYEVNVRFIYHRAFTDGQSDAARSPHGYWTMEFMTTEFTYDTRTGTRAGIDTPEEFQNTVYGVQAFRNADSRNPENEAVIGIDMFNALAGGVNLDALAVPGGFNTRATLAFDSNGNLLGIGRVDEDGQPLRFLPDMVGDDFTEGDWVRGDQFDFQIVPIRNVSPSATLGDTSRERSVYGPADETLIRIGTISFNFETLRQMGNITAINSERRNGGGPGELEDISVGRDGVITGRYTNGRQRILGQIPLAFFANPEGLDRVGNNLWRESANSGNFDGTGQIGRMVGGALEGSNVDLANEFTEMITTQRGFQAASRTITVSDEMLQELVNLRR